MCALSMTSGRRTLELQGALAARGQHRARSLVDALSPRAPNPDPSRSCTTTPASSSSPRSPASPTSGSSIEAPPTDLGARRACPRDESTMRRLQTLARPQMRVAGPNNGIVIRRLLRLLARRARRARGGRYLKVMAPPDGQRVVGHGSQPTHRATKDKPKVTRSTTISLTQVAGTSPLTVPLCWQPTTASTG